MEIIMIRKRHIKIILYIFLMLQSGVVLCSQIGEIKPNSVVNSDKLMASKDVETYVLNYVNNSKLEKNMNFQMKCQCIRLLNQ